MTETARGRVATGVWLLAFGALACALRVALGYRTVLGDDVVMFLEGDAWYHMRLIDSLVQNFPHRIWFDPYLLQPGGQVTRVGPVMDWIIATVALLVGLGRPSPALIDLVGACSPPVFGALTTVPVYFLGRELFSRRAGLFGAAIVGVLPGQILFRSLLGFTDHHCLETLLSTVALTLIVFAVNPARSRRHRNVCTVLSGIALGTYLLTWSGGTFLVGIICLWGLGSLLFDRLRQADSSQLVGVLVTSFGIAAVMILPWAETTQSFGYEAICLAFGLIAFPLLWALGRVTRRPAAYVAAAFLSLCGVLLGLALLTRSFLPSWLELIQEMSPSGSRVVAEAMPLFKTGDPHPFWTEYTTSAYLAMLAFAILLRDIVVRPTAKHALFLTWTAGTFAATLGQVRFSYYLAVSVALLAGAACDRLLQWTVWLSDHLRRSPAAPRPTRLRHLWPAAGSVVLALAIVTPGIPRFRQYSQTTLMIRDQVDAFAWMRVNTPDPFDDPDTYYKVFRTKEDAPDASYGVMASWPWGYPIIRLARRVPNANGTQAGALDQGAFLLAEDEDDANEILTRLNTRYVMTDWLMVEGRVGERTVLSQFASTVLMAGRNPREYREVFYRRDARQQLEPLLLYYPKYYRSIVTRLQTFGGAEVTPVNSTWVISFSQTMLAGKPINEIQTERLFPTYEDAVAYVDAVKSDRLRIVSRNPSVSPVPLPALQAYAPVYQSLTLPTDGRPIPPTVRIFEYRRWRPRPHSS